MDTAATLMATAWSLTDAFLAARVRHQQALFPRLQLCHQLLPLELTQRLLRVRLASPSYRLQLPQLVLLRQVQSRRMELVVLLTTTPSVVTGLKVAVARKLRLILVYISSN